MEMFKENRQRLCQRLRDNSKVPKGAIVILQGGISETRYCSDHEPLFRQVSDCESSININMLLLYFTIRLSST